MTAPLILAHHLNAIFCILIGIPINSLLLWLISRKTSKEKKMYNQILMQSAIMDIILLIFNGIVQPVFFVEDGIAHDLIANQFFCWLPNPANHILFICWFIAFYFSMVGLGVQFVYRYLVLCRNFQINSVGYFALLSIAFILQLPLVAFLSITSFPNTQNEFILDERVLDHLGNGPNQNGAWRLAIHADMRDPLVLCWFAMYLIYNAILYSIIIFCAARIRTSLAKQIAQFEVSKSSGELNGQITRTLLVQAFLPFFPLILSSIAVFSALLLPQSANSSQIMIVQMLVTIPLSWVPMANPFLTLLIVKQYRKWMINLGKFCIGKIESMPAATNSKTTIIVVKNRAKMPPKY